MTRSRTLTTTGGLALCSAAAGAVLLLREGLDIAPSHWPLAWNLFLAWIPYLLGLGIDRLASRTAHGSGLLVLPTALWLLFFPNAPYIVTDLVHLRSSQPRFLVVDAALIAAFAGIGMALGLLSLNRVHAVVARRLGERLGWAFVGTVLLLTGAGVWMGRVLRWNSWDVLTNPRPLLARTTGALLAPWEHPHAVGFTLLFALGLLWLYRRFLWSPRAPRGADRTLQLL